MNEDFLHYLWKFQYFEKENLQTSDGRHINIIKPGNHNLNSGPDFNQAHIILEDIEWYGSIEIHLKSSDWFRHGHQNDAAYNNTILHVVWQHDEEINIQGKVIPTLELKSRVKQSLLTRFQNFFQGEKEIVCSSNLKSVPPLIVKGMVDKALVQRLEKKSQYILEMLVNNKGDWDETTFQLLGRNFGFQLNSDTFLQLCQNINYKTVLKEAHKKEHLEALFFGTGGFLESTTEIDQYYNYLRDTYHFLKHKYELDKQINRLQWKFSRLRPANFPTLRLAQFAALIHKNPQVFTLLIETSSLKRLKKSLMADTSPYWQEHYAFHKKTGKKSSKPGLSSLENIMLNTAVPLLFAYAKSTSNEELKERALLFLEQLKPENNRITRIWKSFDIANQNAFDSQGLLELYKEFCIKRRCLHCNIGVSILRPSL